VEIRCGFEAVQQLGTARFPLNQLAPASPGEYFVFGLDTKQVVVGLSSMYETLYAIRDEPPLESDAARREDLRPVSSLLGDSLP
jgi:hypothetical protein